MTKPELKRNFKSIVISILIPLKLFLLIGCNEEKIKGITNQLYQLSEADLEPINIPITEEFESNYRYISYRNGGDLFYINEGRFALNQFQLESRKAMTLPICETFQNIRNIYAINVSKSFIYLLESNNLFQLTWVAEKSCLAVVKAIPISKSARLRMGLPWDFNFQFIETYNYMSKELKKISLYNGDIIGPTYPLPNGIHKRDLFLKINPENESISAIKIPMSDEFWEEYEHYPKSEPYHLIKGDLLIFHFMFNPVIYTFHLKTQKLTSTPVEGFFLKTNSIPFNMGDFKRSSVDGNKIFWSLKVPQFKDMVWHEDLELFYRVELKNQFEKEMKEIDFDENHIINVISKDFKPLYSFEVPEGAIPLPIPMGKKVYFQMVNKDNEDEIRFVAIDPMNIAKSK